MKLFALVNTIVVVVNQGESTYLHSLVYVKGKHFFNFSYSKEFHGISVLKYTRKWALRSYSTQTNGIGSALAIERWTSQPLWGHHSSKYILQITK